MLALATAPAVLAAAGTGSDAQDGGWTDVESVSHDDADGIVTYVVRTFAPIRGDQVGEMRWELDLDGDGAVRGSDDGCIVMKPVRGKRKLRAGIYEACHGSAFATADARPHGQTIKLRVLLSELEHAGLDDDAPGYAYRFTSLDGDGITDTVPDDAGLITHTLTGRTAAEDTSDRSDVRAAETTAPAPRTPTAPTAPLRGGKDTTSAGTADETTVEPGEDVDIEGTGFARSRALKIFLVGGATSTATQASPTPTASASPTPTPSPTPAAAAAQFSRSRTSGGSSDDVVVGQRVGTFDAGEIAGDALAAVAATDTRTAIGFAISDNDGNLDDEAEIPDETTPGSYQIVVEGPNPSGGTNTVTIPITVAAQVDPDASSSPAGTAPSNATGTATQASPVATTAGGGAALPQTGSNSLQRLFGVGLIALLLGASLLLAKRIAQSRPATAGVTPPTSAPTVHRAFEVPTELRGEMQRLLARRPDRHDPDRHTDL